MVIASVALQRSAACCTCILSHSHHMLPAGTAPSRTIFSSLPLFSDSACNSLVPMRTYSALFLKPFLCVDRYFLTIVVLHSILHHLCHSSLCDFVSRAPLSGRWLLPLLYHCGPEPAAQQIQPRSLSFSRIFLFSHRFPSIPPPSSLIYTSRIFHSARESGDATAHAAPRAYIGPLVTLYMVSTSIAMYVEFYLTSQAAARPSAARGDSVFCCDDLQDKKCRTLSPPALLYAGRLITGLRVHRGRRRPRARGAG
jgi:hypothetical protein